VNSDRSNVFEATDEGLEVAIAPYIAPRFRYKLKRSGSRRSHYVPKKENRPLRKAGRPRRYSKVAQTNPDGKEMPKIAVCKSSGETPLHRSSQQGWLDTVKACLEAGADVNVRDNAGWTPLHEATAKKRMEVVRLLLDSHADVNVASNTTGVRPIHDAVLQDSVELAEMLLEAGADPKVPTFAGRQPRDFTRNPAMTALLDKYIAKLDGEVPEGWSTQTMIELSDSPHMPTYKLSLDESAEKNYYLLTDLIARLNISRSTFSQNYSGFKTSKMKWKDFAKMLGKSEFFVHPERLPNSWCEFVELTDESNRILNIRSEPFEA